MNRRGFAKSMLGAFLGILAFSLTGCSAVTDLENWIPVALTSVSAIVKLLGPLVPAPVAATIVLIQAGFSALLTAIQSYKAGSGVLADISNAIAAVESAFASFFQSLSVPATLLNLIEGLAGIILSTIAAFANEISAPLSTVVVSAKLNGTPITYTPKKRNARQFKDAWNKFCVKSGRKDAEI